MGEVEKMIAVVDQAGELIKLQAPLLWSYFSALMEVGFTREEALVLTVKMQARFLPGTNE